MKRYAVFPDISPGDVVFDMLGETVVALYHDRGKAERAARRLNEPTLIGRVLAVSETEGGRS
jgi:hypothetical protein